MGSLSCWVVLGRSGIVLFLAACLGLWATQRVYAQPASESAVPMAPSITELREALDEKLQRSVTLQYVNVPLGDVVKQLADEIESDLIVDTDTIAEEGLSVEESVNFVIGQTPISAREAFDQITRPYDLTVINDDGLLRLTTFTAAQETLYLVVYDVSDLTRALARDAPISKGAGGESDAAMQRHMAELLMIVQSVMQSTSGPWFNIDGSGGSVVPIDEQLMVRQSDYVHREIRDLLKQWRVNRGLRPVVVPWRNGVDLEPEFKDIQPVPAGTGGAGVF